MTSFRLLAYFFECIRTFHLSPEEVQKRQIAKFREIFELAREKSPFYRELYRKAGVLDLEIRSMDDIRKVPTIDKALLRGHKSEELLTTGSTEGLLLTTTSGSTGEPFRIFTTRYEMLTSYVRVFVMYWKSGWRPWHRILMINRYRPDSVFEGEKQMPWLRRLQKMVPLFRRDIVSVFNPPETIWHWMEERTDARVLLSTPSAMDILCAYFEEQDIVRPFKLVVLMSETLSDAQRERFKKRFGPNIVGHYGQQECPTIGFDAGDRDEKQLFSDSFLLELQDTPNGSPSPKEAVVTNLVHRAMPIIRLQSHDLVKDLGTPDCPTKRIGPICGRVDDIIRLPSGRHFFHHHAYAMYSSFVDCLQYKIVQYPDRHVALRLHIRNDADETTVRLEALRRWHEYFPEEPLEIEFGPLMDVSPTTGKFKNIERLEA
ncbi:MAG: hypothetical protein J6Y19_07315 [Kiritimatiellae bacterium]|nr:hypothetical protein [Kiritimatiellia bacterium]